MLPYHVAHLGKAGWQDWHVMQHARVLKPS
jgi:hypothetical protein